MQKKKKTSPAELIILWILVLATAGLLLSLDTLIQRGQQLYLEVLLAGKISTLITLGWSAYMVVRRYFWG